jgi:hypothetical protein
LLRHTREDYKGIRGVLARRAESPAEGKALGLVKAATGQGIHRSAHVRFGPAWRRGGR